MPEMLDQILEAWRTNNRINLMLIDHISDEGMKCTLSKRGGRNVVRQFAHLHNNRVWQLEKRAKDLAEGLHKFATKEEPGREFLKSCLEKSCEAMAVFFEQAATGSNPRRSLKKGIIVYLGYFIAHESHHRGSILLTLKQSGHKLDDDLRYNIWDWERR